MLTLGRRAPEGGTHPVTSQSCHTSAARSLKHTRAHTCTHMHARSVQLHLT